MACYMLNMCQKYLSLYQNLHHITEAKGVQISITAPKHNQLIPKGSISDFISEPKLLCDPTASHFGYIRVLLQAPLAAAEPDEVWTSC